MNTPKISVIIPVYNVEKYLERCLDCVLLQSYTDYELLLIDDGSTDNSGKICDEYARKDSRVRVFHKINGGASSARNLGISNSRGELITFSDADDWMDRDWLIAMVSNIGEDDLVIQGFFNHNEDNTVEIKDLVGKRYMKEEYNDACLKLLSSFQMGYLWSMIFKTDIIRQNDILLNENMSYQEDLDFIFRYLLKSNSFRTVNECHYHYYYRFKNYCHSFEGVFSIIESLINLFSGKNLRYCMKIYASEALKLLLKYSEPTNIREVKYYIKKRGGYLIIKKRVYLIYAIINCFPLEVAHLILKYLNVIRRRFV